MIRNHRLVSVRKKKKMLGWTLRFDLMFGSLF